MPPRKRGRGGRGSRGSRGGSSRHPEPEMPPPAPAPEEAVDAMMESAEQLSEEEQLQEAIKRSLSETSREEDDLQRAIRESLMQERERETSSCSGGGENSNAAACRSSPPTPCPREAMSANDSVEILANNSVEITNGTHDGNDSSEDSFHSAESHDDSDYEAEEAEVAPRTRRTTRGRGRGRRGARRGRGRSGRSSSSAGAAAADNGVLDRDQIVERMRTMFDKSLRLHASGKYMSPCQAISTELYPHQMYALAWMAGRENMKGVGVRGGILADDMGLGKTLSLLSLVMTNFHDSRPLARPQHGFKRTYDRNVSKYLPRTPAEKKTGKISRLQDANNVGKSIANGSKPISLSKLFGNGDSPNCRSMPQRRKDTKQKCKSAKFRNLNNTGDYDASKIAPEKSIEQELAEIDESLLSDDEDEFDSMLSSSSLGDKLKAEMEHLKSDRKVSEKANDEEHFNDGLSDDEEYQNMTEAERIERFKPKLNVDGPLDLSSDDDSEIIRESNAKKRRISSGVEEGSSDFDLPDIEVADGEVSKRKVEPEKSKPAKSKRSEMLDMLTEEQRKNVVVPSREPAICGRRRRPTLIVAPMTLIPHWLQQIKEHVDPRIDLKVFVHKGQTKAHIASELERQDIVLTTYGTLQSELNGIASPLLTTKWLRVCLDEGHFIKNHRSKTAKAADKLDSDRKWIVTGTPIQNNLKELWSLLYWLKMKPFTEHKEFVSKIETPIKQGHPHGFKRLQTVIEAICLRRTKSDEVNGRPLVSLPTKVVKLRKLEFTKEEKTVYDAYLSEGREQIAKFMRRGDLLRKYAHIFAVMVRLRQLCCHRELLDVNWDEVDMKELAVIAAKMSAERERAKAVEGAEAASEEEARRLAEQLRKMIKEGLTDDCSICLSDIIAPVITACAHVYCRECITQHIEACVRSREDGPKHPRCPLCRGDISLKTLIEAAEEVDEDEDEESEDMEFEDVAIKVSSTKINAVLEELERTRKANKRTKTVVVSQFTSLLSMLQPLLRDEGYKFTRLDGTMSMRERAEVVAEFQDEADDAPTILLLSLRAGGVGLNLTAANKMLLLDPAWNPATEEQCFDRIHRMGQTKEVTIIKFVMKDSIEERMLAIQEKKRHLISGAFRQTEQERRQQRIQDIRDIFGI